MTQSAILVSFAILAVLLFVVGHILARRRRTAPAIADGRPDSMQPLVEGAEAVNKIARDERLALAVVAERSGDAVVWFAHNIANVIGAWRKNDRGEFEPMKGDGDVQSLYTRPQDIDSYLRWARAVQ